MNKPHGAGRWRRLSLRLGACVALVLTLSGCAGEDGELNTLEPRGTYARSIDRLFTPVGYIAIAVMIFVFAAVLYMWWRFRVDEHVEGEWPVQNHGNTKLEIAWTIIPLVILVVISVPSLAVLQKVNKDVDERDLTVVVVGQQWWWEFRYYLGDNAASYDPKVDKIDGKEPDLVTAGQLVMPTGRDVRLVVTSRDVIHSFWIPTLNGKRDAVPGRFHPWKIQADNPGVYFGQCTEFCGLSHSRMRMQAVAVTPADFTQWVADQQAPYEPAEADKAWLDQQREIAEGNRPAAGAAIADPQITLANGTTAAAGIVTFRNICTRCHLLRGVNDDIFTVADQVAGAAPDLTHFASRTTFAGGIFNLYNADGTWNRTALEAWLRDPPAEKDAYAEGKRGMPNLGLSADQIEGLVEFLMSTGQVPNQDVTIPATEVE
ncbi:MAG TPA: cytochrome c oxidase subunit II [Acidimicrobiales bacterium]|nr:cytochrome c oxidase subunit II [Acidimicrobiales bacterium]